MLTTRIIFSHQRGGFSPFMFGILAGMALFSASIRGHLQSELQRAEEAKLERTRQETQALARAVESAIMTETSSTYSTDVTLNRIMPYADGTTGRTAGGSAAQINTFQAGPMGRVMVGLTDDGYVRNELATAVGDLTQSQLGGRSDVALVDIAALRTRQMELSLKNLDQEAGLLYYFWNRQNRFPTDQAEYKAQVNAVSGLRDFWGRDFTYTAVDANNGGLTFTTPWGEARSISVTMVAATSTTTPTTGSCTSVGQAAQGGSCVTTGPGALIAANADGPSSPNYRWATRGNVDYGPGLYRGANSLSNGIPNTAILSAFEAIAHPAAHYCGHLVQGGYDDWYLPARDELTQVCANRAAIGGFSPGSYWSSTEADPSALGQFTADHNAWSVSFPSCGASQHFSFPSKKNLMAVRCVRRAN